MEARSRATHVTYKPNRRFVDNRFAKQLFENRTLRHFLEEQHLTWEAGQTAIAAIYAVLMDMPFYKTYMSKPECTYEDDKMIWRKIMAELLPDNSDLLSGLEELEVALDQQNWTVDVDVVLSYVVKSIRQFREENGADQKLLQMFDSEDELKFAQDLLTQSIEHHDESMALVHAHLKNWDADRLAFMDTIILQIALAELMYFPDIALEVTLNEYIELAKEYSGDKSYLFVNGILNEILLDLKRNNKLIKAMALK
jgi:N utilization substance protein B